MAQTSSRRVLVRIAMWIAILAVFWGSLEYIFRYHFPGFPMARTPSLRLELYRTFGLQKLNGQFGQDLWIAGVVFPGVKDGYFVDIGAADGTFHSNTKALEDLGWTGVAIDPLPTNFDDRKAKLFKEVVSDKAGEVIEFRVNIDTKGLSGMEKHLGKWKDAGGPKETLQFTTTTIGDILDRAGAPPFIHYISLDIEGAEEAALKGFPFDKYKVGAWTIEHNGEEPKRTNIRKLLEKNGYRFYKQQVVDDWYVGK